MTITRLRTTPGQDPILSLCRCTRFLSMALVYAMKYPGSRVRTWR